MKITAALSLAVVAYAQVRATYHDYEGDRARLGRAYDNSPGWCGIRYSVLNVARITAINGMNAGLCNQCLEVQNVNGGPVVYVLAVDWKADPGLDIARSSYAALTPGANPLDPQQVRYRVVDPSHCAGICQGTADECTPGRRNLLPAYLLPPGPFVAATFGGSGGGPPSTPAQETPVNQPQSGGIPVSNSPTILDSNAGNQTPPPKVTHYGSKSKETEVSKSKESYWKPKETKDSVHETKAHGKSKSKNVKPTETVQSALVSMSPSTDVAIVTPTTLIVGSAPRVLGVRSGAKTVAPFAFLGLLVI
jgi:hypothetical protein